MQCEVDSTGIIKTFAHSSFYSTYITHISLEFDSQGLKCAALLFVSTIRITVSKLFSQMIVFFQFSTVTGRQ